MTTYLRSDEYVPFAPKNVGTVHINHANCPAGEDRKKRLYITRCQNGTVVAYCHHCTLRGSAKSGGLALGGGRRELLGSLRTVEDAKDHGGSKEDQRKRWVGSCKFPSKSSFEPAGWPQEVRAWYQGFGITDEEVRKYGFGFVSDGFYAGRLGLPCYANGKLNGIQFRNICATSGPKYLSRFADQAGGISATATSEDAAVTERKYFDSQQVAPAIGSATSTGNGAAVLGNAVVVVEDVLSAIKVGRHCRAIACLTSTAPENIMLSLAAAGYTTCYVWLDNDNVDVNRKARSIERHLGLFFPRVVFVTDHADPKHYSDEEILNVLSS